MCDEEEKLILGPYPTNQEVRSAIEKFDSEHPEEFTVDDEHVRIDEIHGFARRIVDALCDRGFMHGWYGDTSMKFREEHYDFFYSCFLEYQSSCHEQFNHAAMLHPNKISGYVSNLKRYCGFNDEDIKLYWHAFTRGPVIDCYEYRPIW